jgi:hypothetical protein
MLVVMIQEPFNDNLIRTPLKVDGPGLPGAQMWNPASLGRRWLRGQGVVD